MKAAGWIRGRSLEKVIAVVQERNDNGWNESRRSRVGNVMTRMKLGTSVETIEHDAKFL